MIAILLAPAAARAQDVVVYYHTDAIGSVRALTDATGAVIARYDFLPFGELWPGVPPAPTEDRRFAGKERETIGEFDLDYFGARYHFGVIGRFTGVDPVLNIEAALTDPQRWNRYSYAVNRPLTMVDSDGREAGYIYLRNGQMVAPVRTITNRMATLWGGTIAVGAAAIGGAIAQSAAGVAPLAASWVALTRLFNTPGGQQIVQTAAELATGADLGPAGLPFSSGSLINREYSTAAGTVEMLAEAVVSGKTLHLKDVAVYPKGARVLEVGTKGMLELLQMLKVEARSLGFDELRITGLRRSGANPGKEVDLLINLNDIRK
jgi:RHS repeat-associated protein